MTERANMDYIDSIDSPLGKITIASDGEALVGLWLEGQEHFASKLGEAEADPDVPVFAEVRAWLARYFEGRDPGPVPRVNPRGSAFQQAVWSELARIPYGQLTSYGALARRVEETARRRTSARAVGSAVGRNPISIIVPCHRVVGSSGALTGYAGGVDKKIALLRLEGVAVDEEKQRIARA